MTMKTSLSTTPVQHDTKLLNRLLDKTKTKIFTSGSNAAFLAHILCSVEVVWTTSVRTAAISVSTLYWNPDYFMALNPEARVCILIHELWHKGLLHMVRRGNRNPKIWNEACDTVLDNMMDTEGYQMTHLFPVECGFSPLARPFINHDYDNMSAEEIYEIYMQNPPAPAGIGGDLIEPDEQEKHRIINDVVAAVTAQKLGGGAGNLPGEVELYLDQFLKPKLPWEQLLLRWANGLTKLGHSFRRPNRRYINHGLYLGSMMKVAPGLAKVVMFEDVSGSVSDAELMRFNSEAKYIWDKIRPEELHLVQFDHIIQKEWVLKGRMRFDGVEIVGRGGTNLGAVREWIIKHRPTAVIVLSDLQCPPMEKLPFDIPLMWVCVNNKKAHVNQGQLIHIVE